MDTCPVYPPLQTAPVPPMPTSLAINIPRYKCLLPKGEEGGVVYQLHFLVLATSAYHIQNSNSCIVKPINKYLGWGGAMFSYLRVPIQPRFRIGLGCDTPETIRFMISFFWSKRISLVLCSWLTFIYTLLDPMQVKTRETWYQNCSDPTEWVPFCIALILSESFDKLF